jgi:hypothetical protein
MEKMLETPEITSEFSMRIVTANTSGDGAIPTNRAMVELYPLDDDGPGYLVDRYFNKELHEIQDHWRYKAANDLFEMIISSDIDHYTADFISDVDEYVAGLESRIQYEEPTYPDNCLTAGLDLDAPVCTDGALGGGYREFRIIPGIMPTWEDVTAALDAAVYGLTDGNDDMIPCGNSITKAYYKNFCYANIGSCAFEVYTGIDCASTGALGIDYVSRCAFNPVVGDYIYFAVAWQENETGITCNDYPF